MRKATRRGVLFAAVAATSLAVLTGSALGSGTATAKQKADVRVAFFQVGSLNAFGQATQKGAAAAVKKAGAKMDAFDAGFDAAKQLGQIRDAITTGKYKAFVIFAADGNAILPAVKEAIGKGIKVTAIFTPLGPNFLDLKNVVPGLTSMVGESERQVAQAEAQMTIAACGNKNPCKVVYLQGLANYPPAKGRYDVWRKSVSAKKNIQVVAVQPADFAADPAVKAMQNILQAHPDIDVVSTDGDQMTYGAEQALKTAGLTGKVKLTGNGGGALGLTAIKQGRWYGTVYSKPFMMGSLAATYAIQAVQGKKVPKAVNLFDQQRKTDTGPIVTKRNVGKVKAEWTG